MITLFFNGDMEHPIVAHGMTYNISFERPGQDRRSEYISCQIAQGETFGTSVSNVNHFGGVEVSHVVLQKGDMPARDFVFSAPLYLTNVDSFVGEDHENANFQLQYFEAPQEEESVVE